VWTPNDIRMFRFLVCGASFGLPGLGQVLSSRPFAAVAWMCVFLVTAVGEALLILPRASPGTSGPIAHFPFLAPSLLLVVRLASAVELFLRRPQAPSGPQEWRRVTIVLLVFVACAGVALFSMKVLLKR